jgi:hypothetical protein
MRRMVIGRLGMGRFYGLGAGRYIAGMNATARESILPHGRTVHAAALRIGLRYWVDPNDTLFAGSFEGFDVRGWAVFGDCLLFAAWGDWRTPTPRPAGLGGRISVELTAQFREARQ